MRPQRFDANDLLALFRGQKIATMADLKKTLGTSADATVFRKLRQVTYHTSYSHRGRYYTLHEIADFDAVGLWSFGSVWFSTYGTLIATAQACVDSAEAGYYAKELENILHVDVQAALRKLVRQGRITRQKLWGQYLYCSSNPSTKTRQLTVRKSADTTVPGLIGPCGPGLRIVPDELKAAIILFFSLLDEKQRRLYAGLESLKMGHGGDRTMAQLLGLDVSTVAKGRRQLLARDVEVERVRSAGGGRKPLEKKRQRSSPESKS